MPITPEDGDTPRKKVEIQKALAEIAAKEDAEARRSAADCSSVFCPCCGMPADADSQGYCRNAACDVRTFRLPINFNRKNVAVSHGDLERQPDNTEINL